MSLHCLIICSSWRFSFISPSHTYRRLAFLASFDLIISTSRKSSATFYSYIWILFWKNGGWFSVADKRFLISKSSASRPRFQNSRATRRSLDHWASKNGLWTSSREIKIIITRWHLSFAHAAEYGATRRTRFSSVDLPTKFSIASVALDQSTDSKRCRCII